MGKQTLWVNRNRGVYHITALQCSKKKCKMSAPRFQLICDSLLIPILGDRV